MSLDWLVLIILAELLLLPILGSLLYWALTRQADGSQDRPAPYNDARSNQSTPEERDDAQQADPPEEPTPTKSSTSSSSTPEPDGDCERRLRLIRALYFLRGRLEEQGRELLPFERQVIDEATGLLSGGDCVNDARLFISPESYLAPPSLDSTYEAEFIRVYGRSPATVFVQTNDENFVAVTNKLGNLTKNQRLDECDLQILRWPVYKAQSILISGPNLPSCKSDPSVELSDLYFEIDTKYQYLRAVAETRQQCFEIRTFYHSPYNADPETDCWEEEGTREARHREHGVQQDADTRPPHLIHQPEPLSIDERLHQPEAMGHSNPLFPREAHSLPHNHSEPASRVLAQASMPTSHPTPTPTTPAPLLRESRYTPHIIRHEARQITSAMPDPLMHTSRPTPPGPEGLNRTGRTASLASMIWSTSKPAKKRQKQD